MSRDIVIINSFKRDIKKHYLSLATAEWAEVLDCLVNKKILPKRYLDHALTGNFKGFRDCHIKNDLVLIYAITENDKTLELHYLGSHSEIFK